MRVSSNLKVLGMVPREGFIITATLPNVALVRNTGFVNTYVVCRPLVQPREISASSKFENTHTGLPERGGGGGRLSLQVLVGAEVAQCPPVCPTPGRPQDFDTAIHPVLAKTDNPINHYVKLFIPHNGLCSLQE